MDLSLYIQEQYYLIVVLLYLLGSFIKRYTKIPNWCIPMILSILGGGMCTYIGWFNLGCLDITATMQGIMCGLTAVGTNQIIKQTVQNINSDSEG